MVMAGRSQVPEIVSPQSETEEKYPEEESIATSDRQRIHLKKLHELVGDV